MSGTFRAINPRYPEGFENQRPAPKWEVYRLRYAEDLKKRCPACRQGFKRNDLAVVVTEPYQPGSDQPGELRKQTRTKIYHRPCWFEEQGRPDWYYPGALADIGVGLEETDPGAMDDMPEAVEGVQVALDAAEPAELPGALPPPRPRLQEKTEMKPKAGTEAQAEIQPEPPVQTEGPESEELGEAGPPQSDFRRRLKRLGHELVHPQEPPIHRLKGAMRRYEESEAPPLSWNWLKKTWRERHREEENPMRLHRRNPNRTPPSERPEVAIYAGGSPSQHTYTGTPERATIGSPSYYPHEPEKKGNGLVLLLVLVGLGGAAFAGYWFLVRAKYSVGQVLQHVTSSGTVTYQVTGLKYSGLTHEYVMTNQTTQASETFSVSSVDGNTAEWIPTS